MAGTNDADYPEAILGIDRDIDSDIKNLVEDAHRNGAKVLLTVTPLAHFNTSKNETDPNLLLRRIGERIRQAAEKSGVDAIIDINPEIAPEGNLLDAYRADNVHFSEEGYRVWAKKIKEATQ